MFTSRISSRYSYLDPFRMENNIPPDCRPISPYRIVSTRSIFALAIASSFWFNWRPATVHQIRSEISERNWIQIALAKSGFWFKYTILNNHQKFQVEFFVRTRPISIPELEFAYAKI